MRSFRSLILIFLVLLCAPAAGCMGLRPWTKFKSTPISRALPSKYELTAGQLVFRSDFVIPGGHRIVRDLTAERDEICNTLSMPASDEPIIVYLFPDDESYTACVAQHFPGIPPRRAFFMETDTELSVYAHWGDRLAEDLRHEVAHGYLHAVAPGLPLWLDEGLAEYFELPRSRAGVNAPHVELLRNLVASQNWRPNLERLEHLTDISEMDQQSYAEAWAWAYFLLETSSAHREMLTAYLFDVRARRGLNQPMSARLQKSSSDPEQQILQLLSEFQH